MAKISLRMYNREIEDLIDHGMVNEAIAHCHHILFTYPKHLETYRLLGRSLLQAGRYHEAEDLFSRLLRATPDDYTGHVGMAIVHDNAGNLEKLHWHLERAFQIQPENAALQVEIRSLRERHTGVSSPKVGLTPGGLANLYIQGDLYPQAIAEIRAALADEPNRPDLQVLLARAYWFGLQKDDARELCTRLLKDYEFCFDANRVMADILTASGEGAELAQPYRVRIEEMDPYTAFTVSSTFATAAVPDEAVTLEKLDAQKGEISEPDWETLPEILEEMPGFLRKPTAKTHMLKPAAETPASAENLEAPDWLKNIPSVEEKIESVPQIEQTPTYEMPDWLFEESQPSETADEVNVPDWLEAEIPAETLVQAQKVEEMPEEKPADTAPLDNVPPVAETMPVMEIQTTQAEAEVEAPTAVSAEQAPEDEDKVPGWLSGPRAPNLVSTAEEEKAEAPVLNIEKSAHGEELTAQAKLEHQEPPVSAIPGDAGLTSQEKQDTVAWLESIAHAQEGKTREGENSTFENDEPLPDWLQQRQSQDQSIARASSPDATTSGDDDAMTWLASLAAKHGAVVGSNHSSSVSDVAAELSVEPVAEEAEAVEETVPVKAKMEAEAVAEKDAVKVELAEETVPVEAVLEAEAVAEPVVEEAVLEEVPAEVVAEEASAKVEVLEDTTAVEAKAMTEPVVEETALEEVAAEAEVTIESVIEETVAVAIPEPGVEEADLKEVPTEVELVEETVSVEAVLEAEAVAEPVVEEAVLAEVPAEVVAEEAAAKVEVLEETVSVEAVLEAEAVAEPVVEEALLEEVPAEVVEETVPVEAAVKAEAVAEPIVEDALEEIPAEVVAEEAAAKIEVVEETAPAEAVLEAEVMAEPVVEEAVLEEVPTEAVAEEAAAKVEVVEETAPVEAEAVAEPIVEEAVLEEVPAEMAEDTEPVEAAVKAETVAEFVAEEAVLEEIPAEAVAEEAAAKVEVVEETAPVEAEAAAEPVVEAAVLEEVPAEMAEDTAPVEAAVKAETVAEPVAEEAVLEVPAEVVAEPAADSVSQEHDQPELPQWLSDARRMEPTQSEKPSTPETVSAWISTLPDWLNQDQESEMPEEKPSGDEMENWLTGLDEEAGILQPHDHNRSSDLPEWLQVEKMQESAPDMEQEEVPGMPGGRDDLPPWLVAEEEEKLPSPEDLNVAPWQLHEIWELEQPSSFPTPTSHTDWHPLEIPTEPAAQSLQEAGVPESQPIVEPATAELDRTAAMDAAKKKEALSNRKQAEELTLAQAKSALERGDIPQALEQYAKLIKNGRQIEETIRDLNESLSSHPVEVGIWQTLGDAYMRADRLKEALEAYNKAEELIR